MGLQLTQDKNLLLASLKMMKVKRPYTELERVVLPCLDIAADLIDGGEKEIKSSKFRFLILLLHDDMLLYPPI